MNYTNLTTEKATQLLEQYGPNIISEPDQLSPLEIIIAQFKSPLIYVLLIAAAISIALGEGTDAAFIIIVVLINSALGFYQEYRAENILNTLKKRVSKAVKVVRKGKRKRIDAAFLVPGDLLILEPGLRIPGDGYLLESNEIHINEALLTGESVPVEKSAVKTDKTPSENSRQLRIYMGTAVIEGTGYARITATGDETDFGKIAASLESKFDPPSPMKLELKRISRIIAIAVVLVTVLILGLGIFRGLEFEEIFLTAVALGVSTIPEGLLISLTVTLALGMNRIMRKKSIVRNLPAAETLGAIDILAIDKTGTLTKGTMQVVDTDFTDRELASTAIAMSNNQSNFIDQAILDFLFDSKSASFVTDIQENRKRLFPFSSLRKYTGSWDGNALYAVGAPEVIKSFCTGSTNEWDKKVAKYAEEGFRMLAVAVKNFSKQPTRKDFKDMQHLGLILVRDPVRKSAEESLNRIIRAGIEIKIITGDLKETSINVLQELNFPIKSPEMISGKELKKYEGKAEFDKIIQKTKLFYRTTPDQKLSIVLSLQKAGYQVGMMGDGVNDSPAIKKAEIGISVDNATDVTKEVADLILIDTNFQTVVDAIEEGRNIFYNLRKIMVMLFADSLSETVLIFSALLFQLPLPLLPLQLLWINLIEDGLPSLALSFEPVNKDLLTRKPRKKSESIFDKEVISAIVIISLVIDFIYFLLYSYMLDMNYPIEAARTLIFAGVSLSSLTFMFSAKTLDSNIWKHNIFNNKVLNLAIFSSLILLVAAVYWPPLQQLLGTVNLNATEVLIISGLAAIDLIFIELIKLFVRTVFHRRSL